jgi:hypothetical protein
VEGVLGAAAVGDGIGERADQVPELQDRAGPAVAQQQRPGAGLGRAHVQEVNPEPVQDGTGGAEAVDLPLGPPPVVAGGPVLAQGAEAVQLRALCGVRDGLAVRPAGGGEAALQVLQIAGGDLDRERFDDVVVCHGGQPSPQAE